MEHLLPPGTAVPISIPYRCTEDYDGGDFFTYPERKGWDVSTWQWTPDDVYFDQNGKSITEVAAFVQCWLYFGLLNVVFEIERPEDDFVHQTSTGQEHITTSLLRSHVENLRLRSNAMTEDDKEKFHQNIHDVLALSSSINNTLNHVLVYEEPKTDTEPLQQVIFTQILLDDVLQAVNRIVWFKLLDSTPEDDDDAPYLDLVVFIHRDLISTSCMDLFLRGYMKSAGWCPKTIDFLQENFALQLQVLAYSYGTIRSTLDHTQCGTDERGGCQASRVDPDYKPQHVTPDCNCSLVYSPIDEIVDMLDEGRIPVFMIKTSPEEPEKLQLEVSGVDPTLPLFLKFGCPYVAVSHVWSDGLGNQTENALPQCQLRRLESLTRQLDGTYVGDLTRHWVDDAHDRGTVLLWLDSLCIPVKKEHQRLRDLSVRMMHDTYKMAGGVLALDPDFELFPEDVKPMEALLRVMFSGWRSRLWTYQEGMLSRHVYIAGRGGCLAYTHLTDVFPPIGSSTDVLDLHLTASVYHSYSSLVWQSNSLDENDIEPALQNILIAMSHRSTTRDGDETICIATFLGLDPSPLQNTDPEDRMPILLGLLPSIPSHILFTRGPRMTRKGFRWAPYTFLSPLGLKSYDRFRFGLTYQPDAFDKSRRLPVPKSYISPDNLGLVAFFPGLRFARPNDPTPKIFTVTHAGTNDTYHIEALDTGTDSSWESIAPNNLKSPCILLTKLDHGPVCLLVDIVGETAQGQLLTEWKAIVHVYEAGTMYEDISDDVAKKTCLAGEVVPWRWWIVD